VKDQWSGKELSELRRPKSRARENSAWIAAGGCRIKVCMIDWKGAAGGGLITRGGPVAAADVSGTLAADSASSFLVAAMAKIDGPRMQPPPPYYSAPDECEVLVSSTYLPNYSTVKNGSAEIRTEIRKNIIKVSYKVFS